MGVSAVATSSSSSSCYPLSHSINAIGPAPLRSSSHLSVLASSITPTLPRQWPKSKTALVLHDTHDQAAASTGMAHLIIIIIIIIIIMLPIKP
jgi:hypothetical protein